MEQRNKNTVSAKNQVVNPIRFENEGGKGIRILFVGNSITLHEVRESIGWFHFWGMAASAKEKDYVHQVIKDVRTKDPDAAFCICQAADWELNYWKKGYTFASFDRASNFEADIIVMRLVENVQKKEFDKEIFKEEYIKLIRQLDRANKAQVIVTTGFWKNEADESIREIAQEYGFDYVYLGDLGDCVQMRADGLFEHTGVAYHPGDEGMKAIAERIYQKLEGGIK